MAEKLAIIGSGPAGLTAALYAARSFLSPLVFVGPAFGGQIATTTEVENYPGFPNGLQGPELTMAMREQAEKFGARMVEETVEKVDFSQRPFKLWTSGQMVEVDAVIIATGATPRPLGVPGEQEFIGRGVSYCATCDGFFFRGQDIAVVGGGDSALEEALFLTKFASSVTLIHRRDSLRASKIMQDRAMANPKMKFLWNSQVMDLKGESKVEGAVVRNLLTGAESVLPITGIFIAIGHVPNTKLFTGILDMEDSGYLITRPNSTYTNVDGVFACGDVQDHTYRQAITAAGSGCMAAIDTERWLEAHH
jgi:thioredoxin reductase (NADPH)